MSWREVGSDEDVVHERDTGASFPRYDEGALRCSSCDRAIGYHLASDRLLKDVDAQVWTPYWQSTITGPDETPELLCEDCVPEERR